MHPEKLLEVYKKMTEHEQIHQSEKKSGKSYPTPTKCAFFYFRSVTDDGLDMDPDTPSKELFKEVSYPQPPGSETAMYHL